MINVKLRCRNLDTIDMDVYNVVIYDKKFNVLLNNNTNDDGWVSFNVPCQGVYKIHVLKNKTLKMRNVIYISENNCNIFYFKLKNNILTTRFVNFKITDSFYKGLPIKEGKLILCQKNT